MSTDEKDVINFFRSIEKLLAEFPTKKSAIEVHTFLKEFYKLLQHCHIKIENFHNFTQDQQNILISLLQFLISILSDHVFPVDSLLLGGTCLSVFVANLFVPKFASVFLISLYNYVGRNISDSQSLKPSQCEQIDLKEILSSYTSKREDFINLLDTCQEGGYGEIKTIPTFPQIAILHGVLSYKKDDLFLYKAENFKNIPFLIAIFEHIYVLCISPCSSQYHAFSVLQSWLKMCEKHLFKLLSSGTKNPTSIFSAETEIVTRILSLLESNWESPIKGVSAFVKECYKLVIGISMTECEILKKSDFDICYGLLEPTMKLSWQVKGKYIVLSVILQFVDYKKFLQKHLELPEEVIFNLKANYASAAVSEVYKSIICGIKNCNSSDDIILSEWSKWWRKPILKSLNSTDKSLIQNVINHILPWTMKNVSNSYNSLLEGFSDEDCIFPQLTLLRVAKESGLCILNDKEIRILEMYLHHQEISVRTEILSILCCSPKKSDSLLPEELKLIKNFILVNLNIDSTPFQQQFLSQIRILLVRIRDSLVQEYRLLSKSKSELQLNYSQLEFVEWLFQIAIKNTYPGACFQRRRICLLILNTIFDVFIISVLGNKRKEKPSKLVEQVIQLAQVQQLWIFFNDDSLLNILPCLTDFTDEIRSTTFDLLSNFSKWPTVENQSPIFKRDFIFSHARELCNHPDYRNNDAGAHLYCLVFKKLCINDINLPKSKGYNNALEFLYEIINSAKCQLNSAKQNFLNAASASPIHGLLLALQYCLSNFKDAVETVFETEMGKTLNFLEQVLNLCDEVIHYMLQVMKGNDEKDNCPSFMDIGKALEKLVISQQKSHDSKEFDKKCDEPNIAEKPSNSELELLLSCCWHSIKNSCSLLCEVSIYINQLKMDMAVKKQYLKNIATILSSILISCRHRGVVDACSLSLNRFCVLMLKDELLHEEICKYLLNMVFESLSEASSTSVTRRSAGLPSLCQAIISSEKSNINRKLLSYTINILLETINQPTSILVSDKTDLPQAHAYHILKALVMEASLSQAILLHLDSIIPACVIGFSSKLWPIQNGALQLFGVLLPRICGQKKVSDDDSEYNLVSASELFSRCPSLEAYLLQQLHKCVNLHNGGKLSSELIPVLSIIVKLSPPQENNCKLFNEMKTLLLKLVGVPVWKIRDLVSSILAVIMSSEDILMQMVAVLKNLENNCIKCNEIHGVLYTIEKFLKRNKNISENHVSNITNSLKQLHPAIIKIKVPLLEAVSLDIILLLTDEKQNLNAFEILESNKFYEMKNSFQIGKVIFDDRVSLLSLKEAQLHELPEFIEQQLTLDLSIQINSLKFLSFKLHSEQLESNFHDKDNLENWQKIYIAVNKFIAKEKHPSVVQMALNFIIGLCKDWELAIQILDSDITYSLQETLMYFLITRSNLSVTALSLTLWSFILKYNILKCSIDGSSLEVWNMLFNLFSQPRSPDILRMQAAHSASILGPTLVKYLTQNIYTNPENAPFLIGLCEGCLLILQDEDEDIRNKACEFPSIIDHKYQIKSLQFNIGIDVVFELMYETLCDNDLFLQYLWNRLQNYPNTVKLLQSSEKTMKTNLFQQEYVNVYAEPIQLLIKYKDMFVQTMKRLHDRDNTAWEKTIEMFLLDIKAEIQDTILLMLKNGNSNFNHDFAYPHLVFLAFKKLDSAVETFEAQKHYIESNTVLSDLLKNILCDWNSVKGHLTSINCWFLNQL